MMGRISWRFRTVLLILGATLAVSLWGSRRVPDMLVRPLATVDGEIDGWLSQDDPPIADRTLARLKPTEYLSRTYRKGALRLGFFIAYYSEQRAGESMHSPKNCLPGSGWEILGAGTVDVPAGGATIKVNRYAIQNGTQRMLVLYWYQSRERIIASEYAGKIFLVKDAVLDGRTGGSLVRVTVADDSPEGLATAIRFASAAIPRVQACLGGK
jgi:EpsI family protein